MRPQSLPRLIRVNPSTLHRQRMLMLAVCLRIVQRRCLSMREIDQNAEENFNQKATSESVNHLLKNPQRDIHNYDKKPSIQFSSPAIPALHARIGLPATFPLTTLGRCLTDPSVEKDHSLHNEALSVIGSGLLEYYVSEYLCVRWPRLPMKTQLAALWAFTGESALARIARDWGVQSQTTPKGGEKRNPNEFDNSPRLLVNTPSTKTEKENYDLDKNMEWEIREQARQGWLEPRGQLARKGFLNNLDDKDYGKRFVLFALQRFVQSLVGGVYVHAGTTFTQTFIKAHILSRTLPPLSTLHIPQSPAQELTRLCERLQIPLPISRLIAESGRLTRAPVFVVGVYSGREKLGEGQGASLKEAKTRANINALRAWYLYEQAGWEFAVPSRTEDAGKSYVMGYIDPGSIVL